MREEFSRTEMLLGGEAMEKLTRSRVAVFGVGGVGGYVCEALARSGVGALDLIDKDMVALSNINRQIIATHRTVGREKTDVMRERILDINPEAVVRVYPCFFLPENADSFPFEEYDYVVDAVDTVTAKIELVMRAREKDVPIISSMGAGNKLDSTAFRVADIYETKVCPLARVMRRELKKRDVEHLKVVYSEEKPIVPAGDHAADEQEGYGAETVRRSQINETADGGEGRRDVPRRQTPGSAAFVPSVAGLIIAGEVVKDLVADSLVM
ncbi:MAG: tRNA threonylcarbamoyladenosine dehydratase [Lachnospiraceae bacterium]|nr:tRNA threonylcarbamoyladenosine dehydratase [Lachnospiraceae bacterium]